MSHPFARRAGALALTAALFVQQAGALSNISSWAEEGVAAAQAAGLMPSALEALNAKAEITRAEFCGIAVNAYKAVSGKAVFASAKKPFRDCDDPNVVAAYELGLVSGRGDGIFDPDASIKRQDLCVMLYNILDAAGIDAPAIAGDACVEDYPDVPQISDYAVNAMITMVDYTIVNGISAADEATLLAPNGTATREQALIMAERFCQAFEDQEPEAEPSDEEGAVSVPDYWLDPDLMFPSTETDKMMLVYGVGGEKYQTAEEAEAHMVEISVPVWRLQADGSKTSSTAYIEVNQSLAPIYEAIFEEIYNGDEQFPIKNVGCYSWRTGEHSQGTAIEYQLGGKHGGYHQRGRLAHPDHRHALVALRGPLLHPRRRGCIQRFYEIRLFMGWERLVEQARLHAFQLFRTINNTGGRHNAALPCFIPPYPPARMLVRFL